MAAKPQKLNVSTLPKIHVKHPEVGKALREIVDYINRNVNQVQGNKK